MLPNKLVISSRVDIQHFMIIDCSDGWIMKYYIFWMYQHHMFWYRKCFEIQIFPLFYQELLTRYKIVNWCKGTSPQICLDACIHYWRRNCILEYCFYIWLWNSKETNCNLTLTMWKCIHTIWIIINSVSSDFWGKKIKVASDNQIRLRAKLNTKQFREGHIVWRNNRSKHDGVIFNW